MPDVTVLHSTLPGDLPAPRVALLLAQLPLVLVLSHRVFRTPDR